MFRERQGEKLLPWTEGEALQRSHELHETEWRKIFGDLFKVLILPMSLLLIVIKFGDRVTAGVFIAVMPVLTTQELGHAATFYPEWAAIAGVASAVMGVIMAPYIDRVTALRALSWGLACKALIMILAALLVDYWVNPNVIIVGLFIYGLTGQWLTIASISLFMNLCATKIGASQFAVYMAMSNLALSAGSAIIGPLDAVLEYDGIFYAIAAVDLVMLGLLVLFNLERHKARLNAIVGEHQT